MNRRFFDLLQAKTMGKKVTHQLKGQSGDSIVFVEEDPSSFATDRMLATILHSKTQSLSKRNYDPRHV